MTFLLSAALKKSGLVKRMGAEGKRVAKSISDAAKRGIDPIKAKGGNLRVPNSHYEAKRCLSALVTSIRD